MNQIYTYGEHHYYRSKHIDLSLSQEERLAKYGKLPRRMEPTDCMRYYKAKLDAVWAIGTPERQKAYQRFLNVRRSIWK